MLLSTGLQLLTHPLKLISRQVLVTHPRLITGIDLLPSHGQDLVQAHIV